MNDNLLLFRKKEIDFKIILGIFLILYFGLAYAGISKFIPSTSDLAKMMETLGRNLSTVIKFLIAASYVMGVWFISSAVNELRIYGQARTMMPLQTTFTGPLSRLLVGIMLLFLPAIIDVSIYSLWEYGAEDASVLRFASTGNAQWDAIMNGIRILIQTFGYIAVIRGFVLLSRTGKQHGGQPGMFGKGVMHIVGGIMAINIVATVQVIRATLGFAV